MIQTSPIIGGYKMVPSGAEIDKPLPQREPSSSISPLQISLLPLSAADNSHPLIIPQTGPLWYTH
jgi:hypothetical protein